MKTGFAIIAIIFAMAAMTLAHDPSKGIFEHPAWAARTSKDRPIAKSAGSFSIREARHPYNWCEGQITGEFDELLKRTHHKHFPHNPSAWCESKTVAFVESGLRANAVSHADADGLFQLVPGTFRRFAKCRNVFDPACNIDTGIRHQAYLNTFWHFKRDQECRNQLVWASSNWGEGYVLAEQKRQGGALCITDDWQFPRETRQHLTRINRYLAHKNLGMI